MTPRPLMHTPSRTKEYANYAVRCLAPDATTEGDYSLGKLYSTTEALEHEPTASKVGWALRNAGVTHAYAPSVASMSGRLVPPGELTCAVRLPTTGTTLYRNKDLPSDGVPLRPREAFVMSGGGCPVVVATTREMCLVAHASRDSLIDRRRVLTGQPSRPCEGIVQQLIEYIRLHDIPLSKVRLHGYFTLPAHTFAHPYSDPIHGEYNQSLEHYVLAAGWALQEPGIVDVRDRVAYLDIEKLIIAQAKCAGVSDVTCSLQLPASGGFAYTRHPDERLRTQRNLVIVRRL